MLRSDSGQNASAGWIQQATFLAGLSLLPLPTAAQEPAQKQEPSIRVTTRLVQVNVIVRDKQGRPVTNLRKEDFILLDQGREEPLQLFAVSSRQMSEPAAAVQPVSVFTNRFGERAPTLASVTVILLDLLNTEFSEQAFARDQVMAFLSGLRQDDRVALYELSAGLRILHDFTSDAGRLLRAMERYRGRQAPGLDATEAGPPVEADASPFEQWLATVDQRVANFHLRIRVRTTVEAMEAIANHLAGIPGRKNLVWVSGSFPLTVGMDELPSGQANERGALVPERRAFFEEMQRAARAMNHADIAIYPVDARGLMALPTGAHTTRMSYTGRARIVQPTMPTLVDTFPVQETMDVLASRTGGRAFYNTNAIGGAIRRAIDDSETTYTLGFYPSHGMWNSRFRRLQVRVRQPGLEVRHREGYLAVPEVVLDDAEMRALLRLAVLSPLESTAVGMRVALNPAELGGAAAVRLAISIEPRDITLDLDNGRWRGALDAFIIQKGREGTVVSHQSQTLDFGLTTEQREELLRAGVTYERTVPLAPDASELRVLLRDMRSGKLGSVTVPLPVQK